MRDAPSAPGLGPISPSSPSAAERAFDLRPYLEAAKILVITRLTLLTVAYAAAWFLASSTGSRDPEFLSIWNRWDTGLFIKIATFGYSGPQTDPHATALFPLYPLLIRVVLYVGLSPVAAGMLLSAAASLVAAAYLWRLAGDRADEEVGRRAVLYLFLFPTAVFLVAAYSEALFLAGAIPAFYYARQGRWPLVALPAAVAMGTRIAGVFLLLGLLVEFLCQHDFSPKKLGMAAASLAAGVVPLVAYCVFLWAVRGNPFYFLVDQKLGWGRGFVGPIRSFLNTWNMWSAASYSTNWLFAWRAEIVAAVVGLGLVVWALVRREWGYAAYMGSFLAVLITNTWYYSIPRMLLTFFPALIFMAEFTKGKSHKYHEYAVAVMAPMAALGVVIFTQGKWFY